MAGVHNFGLTLRLARRELRGGLGRFGVFLACLALGVTVVAAVGALSTALEQGLRQDARRLMGGDLEVRLSHREIAPRALDLLRGKGEVALLRRMRGMARLPAADTGPGDAVLVELKAVDDSYPLYGRAELEPDMALDAALAPVARPGEGGPAYGAVAEPGLFTRLGLDVGDEVLLGEARLRLGAVLQREPDRAGGFVGLGPRLLLSQEALQASGLLRPGSVVYNYYKMRLDPGETVESVTEQLQTRFPEAGWRIRDYTDASGRLRRFIESMRLYLTLVGLASLLVGGIGVAGGVRGFLEARLTTIAAMKCVGAERAVLLRVYLAQVAALSLLGSALGLALGQGLAWIAAGLLEARLNVTVAPGPHPWPLLAAALYGLLTALAFSLPALSAAGRVSPARLFRGRAGGGLGPPGPGAATAAALCVLALLGLTVLHAGNPAVSLGFAGGALVCAGLFRLLAWGVRRLAARSTAGGRGPRSPALRHALANLHRPGAATTGVIFSLGLGLTVLTAVSLVDGSLRAQIDEQLPERAPSFFFIDIPKTDMAPLETLVRRSPGVVRFESQPSLRGRITAIDGQNPESVDVDPDVAWALRGDRGLTYLAEKPENVRVTAGEWWPPDYDGPPVICLDAEIAAGFGVGLDDTLTLNILGRDLTPAITCLREIDWASLALNHSIVFAPGVLEAAPHAWIATAYVEGTGAMDRREAEQALFRDVTRAFPRVVAIAMRGVLQDIGDLLGHIGLTVRATAGLTLLAGLLVLAETLGATLRRRHYDAVVLKVLGATRGDVLRALAAEFALAGLAASVLAAGLGVLAARAFVHFVLEDFTWHFQPGAVALVILGGLGACLVLGLAGIRRVLGRKAWPVLRNE